MRLLLPWCSSSFSMAAGFANGTACTHSPLRISGSSVPVPRNELVSWVLSFDAIDPLYCACDVHLCMRKLHHGHPGGQKRMQTAGVEQGDSMCVSSNRSRSIRSYVRSTAGIAILLLLLVFNSFRSNASVANQFYNTPTYNSGGTPVALATGDFNRDGKTDVVVLNGNGVLSFVQGDGKGGFAPPKTIATLPGVASNPTLLPADFNGDGNLDLLILQDPGTSFSIYSGHGDGNFCQPGDKSMTDFTAGGKRSHRRL